MSHEEPTLEPTEQDETPAAVPEPADEAAAVEAPPTGTGAPDDDATDAQDDSATDTAEATPEPDEAAPEPVDESPATDEPAETAAEPEPDEGGAPQAHDPAEPAQGTAEPDGAGTGPAEGTADESTESSAEPTETSAEPTEPTEASAEPTEPTEPGVDAGVQPDASTEAAAEPTEADPAPAPAPSGTLSARPVPRPPAGRPVPRPPVAGGPADEVTAAPAAPVVPVPPALTPAESAEAARWGRVDDDGTVWVREESGERAVGQYPGAEPADALAFYVRRFADLHAKVVLFEARLQTTDLAVKEIDSTLGHLTEELAEPAAVGDLAGLRQRLEGLRGIAAERRAAAEAERAAAKEAALAKRNEIVEAAEKIAGTDPQRMQWRPAGEQLRVLLDQWKDAQRHGPRLDRPTEDALWKRFSHARSTFDRERRRWFADLEKRNASAKAEKEALVREAEALAGSTDWGATSAAYRDLMTRWKAAGRASRKDDDALWARFRAAQDVFFAARDASQRATDAEFAANLEVKLALLEEAERLVPVQDLGAAKRALRDLQDRWEKAGKVPRGDMQKVEGRLRAVEQAVRDAEQTQWNRTNPETRARAEGAAAQLLAAIEGLEEDLRKARETGDERKVKDAQAALDARRAWLEQVERAAQDSRG